MNIAPRQNTVLWVSWILVLSLILEVAGIPFVNRTAQAVGVGAGASASGSANQLPLAPGFNVDHPSIAPARLNATAEADVHFIGLLTAVQGSPTPGAVQTRTVQVQEMLEGPSLSGAVLVKWQAILACWESSIESGLMVGDVVEVKGNLGFNNTPDVWLCGPGEEWGSAYFIRKARRPARIANLTATPGAYPGDIILQWTAPGDDGYNGKAAAYTLKYWSWEIGESEWKYATDVEGEPLPEVAGAVQTMTINLKPRRKYYFAIKAIGSSGLSGPISNSPSAWAAGYLISDINSDLAYTPESILGYEVTIVALAARTDDWTLRLGDLAEIIKSISNFKDLKEYMDKLADPKKGGRVAFAAYAKAVVVGLATEIALDLRSQVLWGLHPMEDGDYSLLMLDPNAPLLESGVPYVIKGVMREKKLNPPFESFYYLEVTDASKIVKQSPSPTDPHFAIPSGYTYRYWVNVKLNEVTPLGDNVCTIGMVSERYYYNYHKYIRVLLMEGIESGLIVRINGSVPAPTLGSMALVCGTKRSAPSVYDGWQPISNFLNTTEASGGITLLRGENSMVASHEYLHKTKLVVKTGSPVDLHIYDGQNNHIGAIYDGDGGLVGFENQLADAEYIAGSDENGEVILVNNPTSSFYYLGVLGRNTGVYTETIRVFNPSDEQTYYFALPNQSTFRDDYDVINFQEIPSPPSGLVLIATDQATILDWADNPESDLLGYNIYRSSERYGAYQKITGAPMTATYFTDNEAGMNRVYYYYITAVDTSHIESGHLPPAPNRFVIALPLVTRSSP